MVRGLLGFVLISALLIWLQWREPPKRSKPRCRTCGYLLEGPLHDDARCERERKLRQKSNAEIRKDWLLSPESDDLPF